MFNALKNVLSTYSFQGKRIKNNNIDIDKWENVNTLIKIDSERYNKTTHKQEETAIRYYISSLNAEPDKFNALIRSHWGIENKLHWQLDVSMGEDASRKRAKALHRIFRSYSRRRWKC